MQTVHSTVFRRGGKVARGAVQYAWDRKVYEKNAWQLHSSLERPPLELGTGFGAKLQHLARKEEREESEDELKYHDWSHVEVEKFCDAVSRYGHKHSPDSDIDLLVIPPLSSLPSLLSPLFSPHSPLPSPPFSLYSFFCHHSLLSQ